MTRAHLFLAVAALLVPAAAQAQLPTKTEAMALAFPDATVERHEYFLTPEQVEQVKSAAQVELKSKLAVAYTAKKDGKLLGVALFDTHVVRTAPETAMVAISPDGKVVRVEVVQFREPAEYGAPEKWVEQLSGKSLSPELTLRTGVKPLSGASLTAQSLVDATRRSLALAQVLHLLPEPK